MKEIEIETPRLILRKWLPEDLKPFSEMCADPKVMEFFPSVLTESQCQDQYKILQDRFDKNGYSFWATELKETGQFIGFIGLNIPGHNFPFSPCVEIGWRLAHPFWGKGYAPEGAKACLKYGFEKLKLDEIVSFTPALNLRSRKVMEKIGMNHDPMGDFAHPVFTGEHKLKIHVLYRMKSSENSLPSG